MEFWSPQQTPKQNGETQQTENAAPKDSTTFYGTLARGVAVSSEFVRTYHPEISALATVIIAIFTIVLGLFTISLSRSTHTAAEAAQQAADVAKKALIDVERPILLISMPSGAIQIPANAGMTPNKPVYGILVENVGKQIATLITGNATYHVQKEPLPPPPVALEKPSGGFCHIRFIGEFNLRPNKTIGFFCQRSEALTESEQRGLDDRSLYGFFRISFTYADPVGTLRNSVFTFVYVPPNTPNRTDPFSQVASVDQVLTKASADEQKEAQRKFVSTLLELYWNIDKENLQPKEPPPPPPQKAGQ